MSRSRYTCAWSREFCSKQFHFGRVWLKAACIVPLVLTAVPEYQLGVAILLTTTAVCSFGVFLISAREGKIQLPVNVREQESLLKDPFDVTTSEDALDGTPVDEDSFWRRMRLWKLAIVLLLAGVLISDCVSLGWAVIEEYQTDLTVCSLRVLFAFYVFLVSARALNQQYSLHSSSVIHLFVLMFVATALLCTTAILPSSQSIGAAAFGDVSVPLALWYNALVLYTSAFLIVVNIPCGPPLRCPSERIYSDKTLMLVNTGEEANVCGVTGASVWDILCFSYCAKVVMLGSSAESIEIADLPIIPADIRTANIYAGMRAAMRRWKLRIRDWCPKLDSGWELTYRLVRVNAHSLILIFILASISAAIFYLSAFFLRRIISYLEKDPWRTDKGWAWVYCAGLFFSNVFVQLLTGQLLSVSWVNLQVPLRVQLNTIFFAKTLVRKDAVSTIVAAPAVRNGAEGEGAGGGGGEAKKEGS